MRKLMMAQVENQGASGYTSAQICELIRAFDFTDYDAVFLEGGVNDFVKSSQVTIGEIAPIGSVFDTSTVYGAWQSAIEYILTNYPSVLIYMDIPAIAWTSAGIFPYNIAKIKGEIAELYNLPCLDLYKKSGINEVNRDYWYCDNVTSTNWRLHFNDYGNALVGAKIAEFMIAN
jgi:lysophospholipase L1-like esterase